MLEYQALGGLGVLDAGIEVSLGGPRQRRLAAGLLIDRNRVVSVDRLTEVVFAGVPTPGAAGTLRSYVARLRRVVERPESGSRVVTRPQCSRGISRSGAGREIAALSSDYARSGWRASQSSVIWFHSWARSTHARWLEPLPRNKW